MKDRIGQVYSAMGGLMAGVGGSTFLAGYITLIPAWGLVLSGGVTLVGLYMMLASLVDWWLPGRKSSLVHVIENARALSASIAVWAGERQRMVYESIPRPETWEADNRRMLRQSQDTMIRWNELYSVKALTAFDQLVAHGADPELSIGRARSLFELPTNQQGIEEVGRTLGVMAAQLEMKAMTRG